MVSTASSSLQVVRGGQEALGGLSVALLRSALRPAKSVRLVRPDPHTCLVTRAQVVQRAVDQLLSTAVLTAEEAVETASAMVEDSVGAASGFAAFSARERAAGCVALFEGLSELERHVRELPAFFEPEQDEGLRILDMLESSIIIRIDARIAAAAAELRLVARDEVERRLTLFAEHQLLRELKATVFDVCRIARRVLEIDRDLEAWCTM